MALEMPDTDATYVARMAVAWNIIVAANYHGRLPHDSETNRKDMVNAFIETYNAILANERRGGKTQEK